LHWGVKTGSRRSSSARFVGRSNDSGLRKMVLVEAESLI
jgi:hypothetical protein